MRGEGIGDASLRGNKVNNRERYNYVLLIFYFFRFCDIHHWIVLHYRCSGYSFLEIDNCLTHIGTNLRKVFSAKHDKCNHKNHKQFLNSDSKHSISLYGTQNTTIACWHINIFTRRNKFFFKIDIAK